MGVDRQSYLHGIDILVQIHQPVILWGAPGIGKTSHFEQLAELLGVPIETVIASLHDPTDFSGLPFIENGYANYAPPNWAIRLKESERGGILFLDEIGTAPPATQAALLRVVLERQVGQTYLGDDVSVVAAANPPEQGAGGWELTLPLANRFFHVDWTMDAETWIEGMQTNWARSIVKLPADWDKNLAEEMIRMTGFIRRFPQHLLSVPKEDTAKAWPSPRSWTMGLRALTAAAAAGAHEDVQYLLLQWAVGVGPALEYKKWKRDLDIPTPQEVLRNPKSVKIPHKPDQLFTLVSSVAWYVGENLNQTSWDAGWAFMARLAEAEGAADIGAIGARQLDRASKTADNKPKMALKAPHEHLGAFRSMLRTAGKSV